jgi:hypothetical protein
MVLATTFYTAALERPLEVALAKHHDGGLVQCVPYNQLNTFLLRPSLVIPEGTRAKVVLLLRVEDFLRLEMMEGDKSADPDAAHYAAVLRQREAEFLDVLDRIRHLRLTVMICPAGHGAYRSDFLRNAIRITEHKISAKLKTLQKHLVVRWSEFERFDSSGNWFNPAADRLGHVPFSPEGLAALAEFLVAKKDQMPDAAIGSASASADTADFRHFLASLKVRVSTSRMTPSSEETVIGLMRHTTHFITHPGDRPFPARPRELADASPQGEAWVLEVADRFGNYGVSGAAVFGFEPGVMRVAFLFLTCPVLGRQVEYAVFDWLAGVAERRGAQFIHVPFVNGRDNKVLSQLLRQLSTEEIRGHGALSQARATDTVFRLRTAGLKESISRIAPDPEALAMMIKNMSLGDLPQC